MIGWWPLCLCTADTTLFKVLRSRIGGIHTGKGKTALALLLSAALLCGQALAHSHPGGSETGGPKTSSWAQNEVARAGELGLLPSTGLPEDYSAPMTRREFRLLMMQFIARQNCSDLDSFQKLIAFYLAEQVENGTSAFSDGSLEDAYAYAIGLVQGDGTGAFRPEDTVTRQEAAVMLVRVYAICGGSFPAAEALNFQDAGEIPEWAVSSVAALAEWGIVKGNDEGCFAPEGLCTVEQGIALLLRLYNGALVSRERGNVTPLFSYGQVMTYLDSLLPVGSNHPAHTKSLQVEGPEATLIRLEPVGVMGGTSFIFMVHRQGGLCRVDLGICNTPYGEPNHQLILENGAFTEDGTAFTCTVTLKEDVISTFTEPAGVLLHEKGTYLIAVPVDAPDRGSAEKLPG